MALDNNGKIVLWCGNAPNQKALAGRIAKKFALAGIVIDERESAYGKKKIASIPRLVIDRLRFRTVYDSWKNLQEFYGREYPSWPDVPLLRVPDINDARTAPFTSDAHPSIIAVSGTALVKKALLQTPASIGIINLHTGLSPYVKGGPNCTNWCIANNDWHLTGNTIMWLNAGIDSGNIITSEHIDVRKASSLFDAQKMVMEHAHDLYLRAIGYLLQGPQPYLSVPQASLGKGRLFLTKMWSADKRRSLLKNWKRRLSAEPAAVPQTVDLPMNQNKY